MSRNRKNVKCLETGANKKYVEAGKIQYFPLRAKCRRRKARQKVFSTPGLVTTRRSFLGPPKAGKALVNTKGYFWQTKAEHCII